ncbi:MAG TPA: hypothetical protein VEQ58_22620, partial [Polyangiaceae bacterium]|nr:hypothetical protein [Polyangiaceae bacterium]
MKAPLLTPLSVLLLAVSASAVTLDAPGASSPPLAADEQVLDAELELGRLERLDSSFKRELSELSRESELLRTRTLARGRAYARLAGAGLLPIGGGFHAFVEHAARLERLHRSLARDLAQERQVAQRRAAVAAQFAADALRESL